MYTVGCQLDKHISQHLPGKSFVIIYVCVITHLLNQRNGMHFILLSSNKQNSAPVNDLIWSGSDSMTLEFFSNISYHGWSFLLHSEMIEKVIIDLRGLKETLGDSNCGPRIHFDLLNMFFEI